MILGAKIINFDVFDADCAGLLIEDSLGIAKGEKSGNRLRNLNALIGRNSTGKTSFMGSLAYLRDCITGNVAQASISFGRPGFSNLISDKNRPAEFKIFFKLGDRDSGKSKYIQYELAIASTKFGSPIVSEERVILSSRKSDGSFEMVPLLEVSSGAGKILRIDTNGERVTEQFGIEDEHLTALGLYGKLSAYTDLCDLYREISKWFFCSFSSEETSSYFNEGGAPGGHKHLNSAGSNVGNVLEYIRSNDENEYERIISDIKSKIPTMKKKKNLPQSLAESPDKLFLYLLLLRDSEPHSTIFIETPDKDLYHDMVDVLADEMREYSIRNHYCQIIFSTHNPYIIETLSPREIWVFERSFEKDSGDVTIKCAADNPLVNEMFNQGVGMGAIWYGGHLDKGDDEEN